MEGKKIIAVMDFGPSYKLIKLDDGSGLMVKMVNNLSADEMEDLSEFSTSLEPEGEAKEEAKEEAKTETKVETKTETKVETKTEEEPEELTQEDVEKMGFEELSELCDDEDLATDPEDYEEDEIGELRTKVLVELEFISEEPETKVKEEEPEGDDLTWDDIVKMDYEELADLCDDEKLDTDPDDFSEDTEVKFRRAIAKELSIEAPAEKRRSRRNK